MVKKKVINLNRASSEELQYVSTTQRIDDEIDYKQLQLQVNKSLNTLPPKCKTIFVLSRFENYKYKEIADMLDISIKTVEAQMGIAIKKLNTELKPILMKHFPDLLVLGILISLIIKMG